MVGRRCLDNDNHDTENKVGCKRNAFDTTRSPASQLVPVPACVLLSAYFWCLATLQGTPVFLSLGPPWVPPTRSEPLKMDTCCLSQEVPSLFWFLYSESWRNGPENQLPKWWSVLQFLSHFSFLWLYHRNGWITLSNRNQHLHQTYTEVTLEVHSQHKSDH